MTGACPGSGGEGHVCGEACDPGESASRGGSFPPSPPRHLPASRDPPMVQGTRSACLAHHRPPSCCCLPFVCPVSPSSYIFCLDLESKYYLQLLVRMAGHSANSDSLRGQELPNDQNHPFDLFPRETSQCPWVSPLPRLPHWPLTTQHPLQWTLLGQTGCLFALEPLPEFLCFSHRDVGTALPGFI